MNVIDTQCVLCGECGRSSHGIAAMGRNDLLIGFKTPDNSLMLVNSPVGEDLGVGFHPRSARTVRPSYHENSWNCHLVPVSFLV
jgi:hypothetical protein